MTIEWAVDFDVSSGQIKETGSYVTEKDLRFRLKDGDGNIIYYGHFIFPNPDDERLFEPKDFYAGEGITSIEIMKDYETWEEV